MDETFRACLRAGRREEAFELLYDSFRHKVFRLACSILRDESLAQDATQDVFLRVWRGLPAFKGESSAATWVYAITRNLCLTRAKTMPAVFLQSDFPAGEHGRGPDLDLALDRLPEPYRQALVLFYYEEKSYEAISEVLAIPMGTVKTHIHRARKQLRRVLEEEFSPRCV